MSRTTPTHNLQSPQHAGFGKHTISEAHCPNCAPLTQKWWQRLRRSGHIARASPVCHHANKGSISGINFSRLQLPWTRWTFQTSLIIRLVVHHKHNLQKKKVTFQTQSFFWNKGKGTERFPAQTNLQAQRVIVITYSTLKGLVLTAVLIHNEFFDIYKS